MQLGFIGAGNMASALARGWGEPVLCTDSGSGRAAALAQELGKAHSFLNDITHFGLEPDEATSAVLLRISSAERRLKKGPADVSDAMASTHASTSINASYTVK